MSPMRWTPSSRLVPGPHRAQPFSRVGALETARPAHVVSADPAREPEAAAPAVERLEGTWTRGVTPRLALVRDTAFARPDASTRWQPVEVPENYGLDPDLRQYYGPVWYRRTITRPQGAFADLAFGAVDYLADVVLDGEHLGRHEGYFAPFLFDLSDRIRPGETADLLVRVQDPLEALKDRRLFTRHRKRWIKGVMSYHDSRAGGMPGVMTPGWTFALGQSPPTGGIVGPVTLEASGPFRLDGVFVTPLDLEGGLHVCVLGTNRTTAPLRAAIVLTLRGPDGTAATTSVVVEAPAGATRADLETVIDRPALWWDAALPDRGGQPLYGLTVHVLAGGAVSARREVTFGFRIAEFPEDPRWHYVQNGVPVFVRAVNYIPVQHWARTGVEFYARDFALMRDAHIHSAGVHAHVQSPACYRAADRVGISIVQDFPLQWTYASGAREDPGFVPRATAMAAEMACLLWNHPSVVAYTAHNEPVHALRAMAARAVDAAAARRGALGRLALAAGGWAVARALLPMPDPDDESTDSGNLCLDRALARTLSTLDPSRFVHQAAGTGHDVHVYAGTIGGGTVYDVGTVRAPFVSEYGSFPIARRAHGRHDAWATPWPPGPRQLQLLCRQGFIAFEALGAAGNVTRFHDLPQLAEALERKAAFVAQYQTEFFRIHRNDPYTGCRWYYFVNHWGYMGGGLLDVDREPTLAYHALAAALRPRLAAVLVPHTVFARGDLRCPAFAMNERLDTWEARVDWRLEALPACDVLRGGRTRRAPRMMPVPGGTYVLAERGPGTTVGEGRLDGTCHHDETVCLGEIDLAHGAALAPGPYRLTLSWDEGGSRQANGLTLLVTRAGWRAPVGLTRITASDVG
jgi:beta-mannosidase